MKILLSPCFQMFDEKKGGSDPLVAFSVGNGIASRYTDSVVITGFKELASKKPYRIIELTKNRKLNLGVFASLLFNFQYTVASIFMSMSQKPDIVHHVLPFWPGRTYNLFALLFNCFGKPLVIGPIFKPVHRYKELKKKHIQVYRETTIKGSRLEIFGQKLLKILAKPLELLSKWTMQKASKIIATDHATKVLIRSLGIKEEKIEVINPGVLLERFEYIPFKKKSKATIQFLAVGYLIERKGFDLIIKALEEVNNKNKNWKLKIIGTGPEEKLLKELVKLAKLDDKVEFVGFIDNIKLPKEYSKAHVFLNMSKDEGFATTAIEAAASGLPVLSSRVGGFNDVVKVGQNGFLVKQGDYKKLAEKILVLMNDKNKINEFGKFSRKLVEKKYDWNVIIDKYIEIYKSAIQGKYAK